MYRYTDKWILCLLCLVVTHVCFSLPEDKDAQIYFRAESVDINQQTHHGVYVGDVTIDQGSTHISAATVTTLGDKTHKITQATLKGNQTSQAHYWTLTASDKPALHAYADIIYYYPVRHFVELVGHARVEQGDDSITADHISYDTDSQHVLSKNSGHNYTTIVIHPEHNPSEKISTHPKSNGKSISNIHSSKQSSKSEILDTGLMIEAHNPLEKKT